MTECLLYAAKNPYDSHKIWNNDRFLLATNKILRLCFRVVFLYMNLKNTPLDFLPIMMLLTKSSICPQFLLVNVLVKSGLIRLWTTFFFIELHARIVPVKFYFLFLAKWLKRRSWLCTGSRRKHKFEWVEKFIPILNSH